jgi:putative glutamine amidotransferase
MDRKRPVIGISAYDLPVAFSHWSDVRSVLVPAAYTSSVARSGGMPVPIPPLEGATELLDLLDGLVFTGGSDLNPALYGQEPHPESAGFHDERDSAELLLIREALRRDMPVLGICRGMQLLNVVRGGTLDQHLADSVDVTPHRLDDATHGVHDVITVPGTRTAEVVGERITVHSHHHQGVATLGHGLIVSAHAEDGVIEAVEDPGLSFCIGALWHPDVDPGGDGAPLFTALVETAAAVS